MPRPRKGRLVVPRTIRIRGVVWRVVSNCEAMRGSPWRGLCLPYWRVIYLAPGHTPTALEDSLLHELLHACLPTLEIDRRKIVGHRTEERVVLALTPALLQVLRQLSFSEPRQRAARASGRKTQGRVGSRPVRGIDRAS